ncbi:MAG: peptide-methionine (S)-S-oxide reductase MsrA [Bacteroidota bacterium]|nr:peptide-methionine (S)-S-oxide reductase MsrA [Bacteroidota bacterium]
MQQVKGVDSTTSGYSGGKLKNPTYKEVCSGLTGHAEVVKVKYDPDLISYEELLRVFFEVHNSNSVDHEEGKYTQYRSIILYHNETQRKIAESIVVEISKSSGKIPNTEISPFFAFYEAEKHHQDYYRKDPEKSYCQNIIEPKIKKLMKVNP